MTFPYPLTESVEILLQLFYSPIEEVAHDYGLEADETKKRMRQFCREIFRNCQMDGRMPVMVKSPFRASMLRSLHTLRRRNPILWDFLFDGDVPHALQTIVDHLWYLLTEVMGYTYEEIVG